MNKSLPFFLSIGRCPLWIGINQVALFSLANSVAAFFWLSLFLVVPVFLPCVDKSVQIKRKSRCVAFIADSLSDEWRPYVRARVCLFFGDFFSFFVSNHYLSVRFSCGFLETHQRTELNTNNRSQTQVLPLISSCARVEPKFLSLTVTHGIIHSPPALSCRRIFPRCISCISSLSFTGTLSRALVVVGCLFTMCLFVHKRTERMN